MTEAVSQLVPTASAEEASLSPLQTALLAREAAGDRLEPRCLAARIAGELDEDALGEALDALVERHESLRTAYAREDGDVRAVVREPVPLQLQRVDLRRFEPTEREGALVRLVREHLNRPLDPASGKLARAALLRTDDELRLLLLVIHQLAADEESLRVLAHDLSELYRGERPEVGAAARTLPTARLETVLAEAAGALRGAPPVLDLPTDRVRSALGSTERRAVPLAVSAEAVAALAELARLEAAELDDVLLAAVYALLARHSGQTDAVLGLDVPGVRSPEQAAVVAPLAELAPVRIDAADDPAFVELVRRAHDEVAAGPARARVPVDRLVDALGGERNPSYHPLYQVALSTRPPAARLLELDGARVEPVDVHDPTPLDLRVRLFRDGDGLAGALSYRTDLLDEASATRIARRLEQLLADAAARPQARVSELRLLPPDEERLMLEEWNDTAAPTSEWRTVHELYEAYARETPDAPAVADLSRTLTYAELNRDANRVAHRLRRHGIGPGAIVGVAAPRSLEALIAFLGVLKAGGAYLPLDPTYPRDRLAYMLEHAGVAAILATHEAADALPSHAAETIVLEDETLAEEPPDDLRLDVAGDCLAYVIYTSGSTGRPKGVELAHRGACNLATALRTLFGLDPSDRVAFFSSLNFDASVWEMLMAAASGACLCVVETAGRAAEDIVGDLRRLRVTAGTFPPSFLRAAMGTEIPSLALVVSAGEQCSAELVRTWGMGRRFVNAYGPTEATVCATSAVCDLSLAGAPAIGTPFPNVRTYVLDPRLRPMPVGARGELFVGGAGLAYGYRKAARQTAEAFVPDPYGPPGSRLYRTGDVTTLLPNGELQYVGRVDGQVKLRGFRIEPGEVEATLARHPDVVESAVVVRESAAGDPQLVAYVVLENDVRARVARSSGGAASDELRSELRDFLQRTLPPYMLPARYVVLDALPLSPSGKVDHAALPELDEPEAPLAEDLEGPQTPTEEAIARIWAENLGLARVGRHDDFLEIGGHSLIAAQVIADVRDEFEIRLPVRVLFEFPVLEEFATAVDEQCATATGAATG
ncbi:MAG TPA: amino acid adenylation domain-containing protein [Gaiellaceae bacterium]